MKFKRKWIKNIILYLLAVLGAVIMIFPFLWMISNAFKADVFVI
jgi:ABC-type glycerol-3-phosphate transport system permease component